MARGARQDLSDTVIDAEIGSFATVAEVPSDMRGLLDAVAWEIAKDGGYPTIEEAYDQALFYLRPAADETDLGDHDPSGIDMTRDVRDRLSMFSYEDVEVRRLALNMDQVEQWEPPENPAKTTDSRYEAYMVEFGDSSWELDAVDPATLGDLVRAAVEKLRDDDLYEARVERETEMREKLEEYAADYRRQEDEE